MGPMLSRLLLVCAAYVAGLQAAAIVLERSLAKSLDRGMFVDVALAPWDVLEWAWVNGSRFPDEVQAARGVGLMVSSALLLGVLALRTMQVTSVRENSSLHGSARWATLKDIRAAGLLIERPGLAAWLWRCVRGLPSPIEAGVYVGSFIDARGRQHYLRHCGPEHVLCYAPTRSGKGVGLVVPTLLSWPQSALVTDLKGELWALTAGWRRSHARNRVLRFEPANAIGSVQWNPLDEIRVDTEFEVGDVQNLALLLVDPDGKGLENHWQKTAHALLVGVILHLLHKRRNEGCEATLSAVDEFLASPGRAIRELWMEMVSYPHRGDAPDRVVAAAARDMLDRPDEEGGSVLSTAKSYLSLYRDPVIAANTRKSEFRIRDLIHHADPVSLYVVTQPVDKTRLRPLVRVLVNMTLRLLAERLTFEKGRPVPGYRHRLLAMLDEFPSLGRLEIMQESLAFVAGYGIKCYLICQDVNQLRSRESGYGADESITSNCHVQTALPPNRIETAEHLSKLTGTATVVKHQITVSGKRISMSLQQVSHSVQEVSRPLLTPDECLRMPGPIKSSSGEICKAGDMVIYVAGFPAIYGRQMLYFQDPTFRRRAALEAPDRTDRLRCPE